jgi:hypothetical protein
MRFGLCGWSEHEEGVKYQLILVDRRYGEESALGTSIAFVASANRELQLAYLTEMMKELTGLLVARSLLLEEEIARAKQAADLRVDERQHGFLQVRDVDLLHW